MTLWRICLLGGLCAEREGVLISRFPTRHCAALLAYLAYFSRRPHPRDALVALLWPDAPPRSARNSLSKALSSLRRLLHTPADPCPLFLADHSAVQLNPHCFLTDVQEFDAALLAIERAPGDPPIDALARAVACYPGELLPDAHDPWVLQERPWLAERYHRALISLLTALERAGELSRAIEQARRGIRIDPLREETHRALIRLLAASGQPALARRQYAELERLLRDELGAAPTEETRALLPAIDPGPLSHPAASASRPRPVALSHAPPGDVAARLPVSLTRFFGREAEIDALCRMLDQEGRRLLTLTGVGGSGKSRLALEVAQCLAPRFPGHAAFVPLAALTDGRRLPEAIRDALGLPPAPNARPLDQVTAALAVQPTLLVLDNLEHLLEEAAPLVATLLERAPALTCLVTSREALRLSGERRFPVAPLPVPETRAALETVRQNASVQLFLDRAQGVAPAFALTEENAAAVAAVCRRLEGVPLAIELAAARVEAVSLGEMARELEGRLGGLVSGMRDVAERHRSLWGALAWSYRLLPEGLLEFFAGLSVFRGGWTVGAAAAVCGERRAGEYLERLGGCSLVEWEERGGERRYRMLETLREFAAGQLTSQSQPEFATRHMEFYAALAQTTRPELQGPRRQRALDRLSREIDNLRAALEWSLSCDEGRPLALGMATNLERFWEARGHWQEGSTWIEKALEQEEATVGTGHPEAQAAALGALGRLEWLQGRYPSARAQLSRAIRLAREAGNALILCNGLADLSQVARDEGKIREAAESAEAAVDAGRTSGDTQSLAYALNVLGRALREGGDYVGARARFRESLRLYKETGDSWGISAPTTNLGILASLEGDDEDAVSWLEEALRLRREAGDPFTLMMSLIALGVVLMRRTQESRAEPLYNEALQLARAMRHDWFTGSAAWPLARRYFDRGEYPIARSLAAEAIAGWTRLGHAGRVADGLLLLAQVARREAESPTETGRAIGREELSTLARERDPADPVDRPQ
jgi:predicted ATPase/DNA-binding SARP family transcriptional activator/Tfp pilus assembly protein PilF